MMGHPVVPPPIPSLGSRSEELGKCIAKTWLISHRGGGCNDKKEIKKMSAKEPAWYQESIARAAQLASNFPPFQPNTTDDNHSI